MTEEKYKSRKKLIIVIHCILLIILILFDIFKGISGVEYSNGKYFIPDWFEIKYTGIMAYLYAILFCLLLYSPFILAIIITLIMFLVLNKKIYKLWNEEKK